MIVSLDTTARANSPHVRRAERHERWSRILTSSLDRHRVTKAGTAAECGFRSPSILSRQLDPEQTDSVAIADVAGMDLRVVRDAARELAQLVGCDLAELPKSVDRLGGLRAAAELQMRAAQAVLGVVTALADGVITRAEARPLIVELNDLVAASLAIRAVCERALVEGLAGGEP
jgi:hypothetical protein